MKITVKVDNQSYDVNIGTLILVQLSPRSMGKLLRSTLKKRSESRLLWFLRHQWLHQHQ